MLMMWRSRTNGSDIGQFDHIRATRSVEFLNWIPPVIQEVAPEISELISTRIKVLAPGKGALVVNSRIRPKAQPSL